MKKDKYKNFVYGEDIQKLLNNTKLDLIAMNKLNEAINITKNIPFYENHCEIYEDLAKMRFVLDLPSGQIAKIYNINLRSVEMWFKILGWQRTREESQQLASRKSRDYAQIRKTCKNTLLERYAETMITGGKVEEYVRHKINNDLSNILKDCEIIVGVNSMNCIDKEVDIPIIIINKNKVIKFAIEVDGHYTHKSQSQRNRDLHKSVTCFKNGYTILRIESKAYTNKDDKLIYKNELDSKINEVIERIAGNIKVKKIV